MKIGTVENLEIRVPDRAGSEPAPSRKSRGLSRARLHPGVKSEAGVTAPFDSFVLSKGQAGARNREVVVYPSL